MINLRSGSPSSLSDIKNPVQDYAAMRCYQSEVSLLNSGYSKHEDLIHKLGRRCHAGESGSYRCADVSAMHHSAAPALTGGLGWLSQHKNIQAGVQSRTHQEAHEKSPDCCSCLWGHRRVGISLLGE